MHLRSIQELRAIVWDEGKDLSDEQLHALDRQSAQLYEFFHGAYLDLVDPSGAGRRRRGSEIAAEELRARRRAKYERERAAIGRTPRRKTA